MSTSVRAGPRPRRLTFEMPSRPLDVNWLVEPSTPELTPRFLIISSMDGEPFSARSVRSMTSTGFGASSGVPRM